MCAAVRRCAPLRVAEGPHSICGTERLRDRPARNTSPRCWVAYPVLVRRWCRAPSENWRSHQHRFDVGTMSYSSKRCLIDMDSTSQFPLRPPATYSARARPRPRAPVPAPRSPRPHPLPPHPPEIRPRPHPRNEHLAGVAVTCFVASRGAASRPFSHTYSTSAPPRHAVRSLQRHCFVIGSILSIM